MAYFLTSLALNYIDGRRWRVLYPLSFRRQRGDLITVPASFVTDFASIPRFFWRVLPPVGDGAGAEYGPASVVHDWLYQSHGLPRAECDRVFLEAMKVLGVSFWRRWLMYKAVRWFGGSAYRSGPARREMLRSCRAA